MVGQSPIAAPTGKLLDADEYAARHGSTAGDFEYFCIQARHACALRTLGELRPSTILEVGIGPDPLVKRVQQMPFERFVIVEPAAAFLDGLRPTVAEDPRVSLVEGYVEQCGQALGRLAPDGFDLAIVSSVLHETRDPAAILDVVRGHLAPGGSLFVTVPNAGSLHRLVAVEMGLIAKPGDLSERNRSLGQPIVFDAGTLRALLERCGFTVTASGGYMLKPFTHAQMMAVVGMAAPNLPDALDTLGQRFPDMAAEIYAVAKPTTACGLRP